jgi:hypothetical protein
MELRLFESASLKTAELYDDTAIIKTVQDALDIMCRAGELGAQSIVLHQHQLAPEFFDLKSGLAGEILQKFSNYRMRLAIVGDFSRYESQTLKAFITECNRGNQVFFVSSREKAVQKLASM